MTRLWIAGVDQSVRHTAVVCLPTDVWQTPEPWALIRSSAFVGPAPTTLHGQARWRAYVADELHRFCRMHDCRHVFFESPAGFDRGRQLGHMLAVMLDRVVRANMQAWEVKQHLIRGLLLGDLKRKGKDHPKVRVFNTFGRPPDGRDWGMDEADALAVANWGIHELGGVALAGGK